jgi:lysophospholipase L1-like esterase
MIHRIHHFAIVSIIVAAAVPLSAADFFFNDGDRVVMIGDSITEQYLYSSYVEAWTLTRFPAWNTTFVNVGINGDEAPGGIRRFKRDVLSQRATALTVGFGMNDGGYRAFDEARFKRYIDGLRGIADQARAANIRVAWLTPSPVEKYEDGPHSRGYNQTLERFSDGVKQIAAAGPGDLFIDQFHPYVTVLDKFRAANPRDRLNADWVHPDPPGHCIMAWSILKGMNFPTLVAAVEIDAASAKIVTARNCRIDGLKAGAGGGLVFNQLDTTLPFFPGEAKKILLWAPVLEELNDYRLKVTGLTASQYEIRLGGKKVAEYSAAALGEGVNMAPAVLAEGPIAEQVKAVRAAIKAKNDYYHEQVYRGVAIAYVILPDFIAVKPEEIEARRAAALKQRMARMPGLFDAIRKALVIKPHVVEVVPVGK